MTNVPSLPMQLWARPAHARPDDDAGLRRHNDAGLQSCDPDAVSAAREAAARAGGFVRAISLGRPIAMALLPWQKLRACAVTRVQPVEEVRMLLSLR